MRSTGSSEIRLGLTNLSSNPDCFARAASEFSVYVAIPDGLPFPYQANQRVGDARFGTGTCHWMTTAAAVVSGTIYQAATNGATNLEGDVTVPYNVNNPGNIDNRDAYCGAGCPGSASARFRFNVPL